MNDFDMMTLPNGIRVVHKQVSHTKISHCGFILDIGSRDERPEQQGIAHFWEHMAFKGTTRRKAYHILNRLDSVGGELNAYTTKEKICFYASVLDTSRVIFSCVSPHASATVFRLVERYLKDLPAVTRQRQRLPFKGYLPSFESRERSLTQAQCAMGRPAYTVYDERRLPFFMLVNLLGGPGLNSRLNLALREKYGFVNSVE